MHSFLHHPAVTGGLAPFFAALLTAELLQRLRLSGLAIAAGLAATIYLAHGFSFETLSAARKVELLGLGSALLGLAFSLFDAALLRPFIAAGAAAAAIWVAQHILMQQQTAQMLLYSAGAGFYAGWLVYWLDTLEHHSVRAGSAGVAIGLGTGMVALFAGAAQHELLAFSMGAAAAAYLLIQMITGHTLPCGRALTLPIALVASIAGAMAALTTHLPWYALIPLAAIPIAAHIPVSEKNGVAVQSLLLSAATLACAAGAVLLTWRVTGAPT